MKSNTLYRDIMKALVSFVCAALILVNGLGLGSMVFASAAGSPLFDADELFTDRDLAQTADLSEAETIAVSDGQDVSITSAGVYLLTGTAKNATIYVEAGVEDKVQLVLDGLTIENDSLPCVYVRSADKVFITTSADSSLSITGSVQLEDGSKLDGVIFSRCDLTLSGTATLTIASTANGVVGKDDLKITGGTYVITAASKAIEANDSIRVAGGTLILTAGTDGLHAENSDDDTLGYIYIGGGQISMTAGDDGIHANAAVQIDDGSVSVNAAEGIESTYIQINGGDITIQGRDDGINAANKSSAYRATIEITGGSVTVTMASGDTDGIDSNGDIYISGGTVNVTGGSTFDYDGTAQYTGGTIIVNGQQVNGIPNQMMGGMRGMTGGSMGGMTGMGGRKK